MIAAFAWALTTTALWRVKLARVRKLWTKFRFPRIGRPTEAPTATRLKDLTGNSRAMATSHSKPRRILKAAKLAFQKTQPSIRWRTAKSAPLTTKLLSGYDPDFSRKNKPTGKLHGRTIGFPS